MTSCNNEHSVTPDERPTLAAITLEQAKDLYERYSRQDIAARTTKRKHKEKPIWTMSSYITLADGKQALVSSLEEEMDALTLVSFDGSAAESKSFEEVFTFVKLVAYKDSVGKEHLERMYIKGDLDYSKRKKFRYEDADFSGRIWFEDMDDNFLRGFFYENGKLKGKQSIKLESQANGRINYTCNVVYEITTTTTDYYSVSDCPDCPPKFMYNHTGTTYTVLWESCYNPNVINSGAAGTGLSISDPAFWTWYNTLNSLETSWLIANPGKAYDAYIHFKQGEVSSQQRFGGATLKDEDGTNQNAYKHAYIAALHNQKWGTNIAYTIMNNHEYGPPPMSGTSNLPLPRQMDYHNNKLGIDTQNDCGCYGEDLRNLIQSQITSGKGKRYKGSNLPDGTLSNTNGKNLDND